MSVQKTKKTTHEIQTAKELLSLCKERMPQFPWRIEVKFDLLDDPVYWKEIFQEKGLGKITRGNLNSATVLVDLDKWATDRWSTSTSVKFANSMQDLNLNSGVFGIERLVGNYVVPSTETANTETASSETSNQEESEVLGGLVSGTSDNLWSAYYTCISAGGGWPPGFIEGKKAFGDQLLNDRLFDSPKLAVNWLKRQIESLIRFRLGTEKSAALAQLKEIEHLQKRLLGV